MGPVPPPKWGSATGNPPRFNWIEQPTDEEIKALSKTIAMRVIRYLKRHGHFRDDTPYLAPGERRQRMKTKYSPSFTPLELMEKLAALVPQPRVHLTRFFGYSRR